MKRPALLEATRARDPKNERHEMKSENRIQVKADKKTVQSQIKTRSLKSKMADLNFPLARSGDCDRIAKKILTLPLDMRCELFEMLKVMGILPENTNIPNCSKMLTASEILELATMLETEAFSIRFAGDAAFSGIRAIQSN